MKRRGYEPDRPPDPLLYGLMLLFPLSIKPQRIIVEALTAFMPRPRGLALREVDAGGVPAKWITGREDETKRTILYLHGGGYCTCSYRTHRFLAAHLCRSARARALIVDYRTAPEHPYPSALEDALSAYAWLLEQGVDPKTIAIAGDSAGGGLCMALLLAIKNSGASLPAAAYLMSPWMDLTPSQRPFFTVPQIREDLADKIADRMARLYVQDQDPANPYISPIYGDYKGLPPLMVAFGRYEPLRIDAKRLYERALQAGVDIAYEPYNSPIHVAQGLAGVSVEAARLLGRGGRFIRENCPAK